METAQAHVDALSGLPDRLDLGTAMAAAGEDSFQRNTFDILKDSDGTIAKEDLLACQENTRNLLDTGGVEKLVGEWTIRWENGRTVDVQVDESGHFIVFGNHYDLDNNYPPTFSWDLPGTSESGTFQWCVKFQMHHITWTTNNPDYPRIWWDRKISEEDLERALAQAMSSGTARLMRAKLGVGGEGRAGKTSTIRALLGKSFREDEVSTIGSVIEGCQIDRAEATDFSPEDQNIAGEYERLKRAAAMKMFHQSKISTLSEASNAEATTTAAQQQQAQPDDTKARFEERMRQSAKETAKRIGEAT